MGVGERLPMRDKTAHEWTTLAGQCFTMMTDTPGALSMSFLNSASSRMPASAA
jgi:hypothetical protein